MAEASSLSTRRCMLKHSAVGFGWLALRGLLDQEALAKELPLANRGPLAAKAPHFHGPCKTHRLPVHEGRALACRHL